MNDLGQRLEARRRQQGKTQDTFAGLLGVHRTTYLNWIKVVPRVPQRQHLAQIARVLGEDEAALAAELGLTQGVDPQAVLGAVAARRDATRVHQNHVRAMALAAGLTSDEHHDPVPSGVDVVARVLRESLSRGGGGPFAVTVNPVLRGSRRSTAFHYQVAVTPSSYLQRDPGEEEARAAVADLRRRVDDALADLLLPVTREHSTELVPDHLRRTSDVLLYPALLEPRPAPTGRTAGPGVRDVLVCGVYQSGAPDVAALIAEARQRGFARIEHLARATLTTGLGTVENDVLRAAVPGALTSVLEQRTQPHQTAVWAVDDLGAVLAGPGLLEQVRTSSVRLVTITLDEHGLDYAGALLQQQQGPPGRAGGHTTWRSLLSEWQARVVEITEALDDASRAAPPGEDPRPLRPILQEVSVPTSLQPVDGRWPDDVDTMFDAYDAAAATVLETLDRREAAA